MAWEGRGWIHSSKIDDAHHVHSDAPSIRFLSYHVFADYKCGGILHSSSKNWDYRKETLIREIHRYDADILCLQDVDHFQDWYQPKLATIGYSCCFYQRTRELDNSHTEGVVVAYKEDKFQLYKTNFVELNNCALEERDSSAAFRERCVTDDVALIAFLQPWGSAKFGTSICVVSAMLRDHERDSEVRMYQTKYLARQIELANCEFHSPVFLGISLHDEPSSSSYHILRSGRLPLEPKAPPKCKPPTGKATCRGSVRLVWYAPTLTSADPIITSYRICWRPGGSSALGYKARMKVMVGDCVQYSDQPDANGVLRTVAKKELTYVVSGLTSELPYEFRIAAVNEIGDGSWSEASMPIWMTNPPKEPEMPKLVVLKNRFQVLEMRENANMLVEDWNTQENQLMDSHNAETHLTPRDREGNIVPVSRVRLLPITINPRTGWKEELRGQATESLTHELESDRALRNTIIRDKDGYFKEVSEDPLGKRIHFDYKAAKRSLSLQAEAEWVDDDDVFDEQTEPKLSQDIGEGDVQEPSMVPTVDSSNSEVIDAEADGAGAGVEPDVVDEEESKQASSEPWDSNSRFADSMIDSTVGTDGQTAGKESATIGLAEPTLNTVVTWNLEEDNTEANEAFCDIGDGYDVVLDAKDVVNDIGLVNKRHIHSMCFRSAYESYSVAAEPLFTTATPVEDSIRTCGGVCCLDYIFYPSQTFLLKSVLSMPHISHLKGTDLRETRFVDECFGEQPPPGFKKLFNQHNLIPHFLKSPAKVAIEFEPEVHASSHNVYANAHQHANALKDTHKVVPTRSKINDAKRFLVKKLACSFKDAAEQNSLFGGKWCPKSTANRHSRNYWLPNDSYASSHLALCADFYVIEENLSSMWH